MQIDIRYPKARDIELNGKSLARNRARHPNGALESCWRRYWIYTAANLFSPRPRPRFSAMPDRAVVRIKNGLPVREVIEVRETGLAWSHGVVFVRIPVKFLPDPPRRLQPEEPWSRPAGSDYPKSNAKVPGFPIPLLDGSRVWLRVIDLDDDDAPPAKPDLHNPRSAEQNKLIEDYRPLAVSIGEAEGRKHPDRVRFFYEWEGLKARKTPRRGRGGPEDELQAAHFALIEALTPKSAGGRGYSPRGGVDFSVPLRDRIKGEVIDSITRDVPEGVLERVKCGSPRSLKLGKPPCDGPGCLLCGGTGSWNFWHRVEIDKQRAGHGSDEGNGDDENYADIVSWDSPAAEPDPEELLVGPERKRLARETQQQLKRAVDKLGVHHALVIRSIYWDRDTQQQIAARRDVHQTTISRNHGEALATLRFILGPVDRDGRNLRHNEPRSAPPRRTGGAFGFGGWMTVPGSRFEKPAPPDQGWRDNWLWRPSGVSRLGLGATGGEWPTAEWKRENWETCPNGLPGWIAKGSGRWVGNDEPKERRGFSDLTRIVGLEDPEKKEPEESENIAEESSLCFQEDT